MSVYSIYVEKKPAFAVEAAAVKNDLHTALQLRSVKNVRLINRYFAENLSREDFFRLRGTIFSEPQVDKSYDDLPSPGAARVFAVEYLPGQFDQRADSCAQCISMATGKERPLIRTARIYYLEGALTDSEFDQVKSYLINPVESREASLDIPDTLEMKYEVPTEVETVTGFTTLDNAGLEALLDSLGLAMDMDDLAFCQRYFQGEGRDPSITEIRMIDTYWSDHCRHTTFLTEIHPEDIAPAYLKDSYAKYLQLRDKLYAGREKPVTLMDMAVIGAKALRAEGYLEDLDESEEINACSVKIKVDVDGVEQDWLLMFKNETHNHPTEIEPFGGAATCLGGAIRDPLSGRSYVYQAMRVTGAADPLAPTSDTMPGKLPQRKIVQTAAAGYSSYGNQIGLATGHVHEIYHPGYVAKRMEIGAVIGAAPAENVVREVPNPGDLVILLGGRTGRDGCGGATGSSKSHTLQSLENCGAEVQKGNAPEERKLQRLFRNPQATRLIRRCNDFGAGGVSVSIGELAAGIRINLDKVTKKYDGLDGTELAISESQERMSVVVDPADVDQFIRLAGEENLEATVVAQVTAEPRLVMDWNGNTIVNLSREFLDSNGAAKQAAFSIPAPQWTAQPPLSANGKDLKKRLSSLAACSQKGLVERFDSNIGAGSVLVPFGGRRQLTPNQAMAAKIPVLGGETAACSLMAWGFDPLLSTRSPYHGGAWAVVESVAKVVAAGGTRRQCWLTFQEYFERLRTDATRWGKPVAALLGALEAQLQLKTGAIGGKDSMSGSFEEVDVPPTLVSFAVSMAKTGGVVSGEFKQADSSVYFLSPREQADGTPHWESVTALLDQVEELIKNGKVRAAYVVAGEGGTGEAVAKMCLGNRLGFAGEKPLTLGGWQFGFVLECDELPGLSAHRIGRTTAAYTLVLPEETVDLQELERAWEATLEPVFPYLTEQGGGPVEAFAYQSTKRLSPAVKVARPKVLIPAFPGTNSEYDTARAFERAGAESEIFVVRNLTPEDIRQSVEAFAAKVDNAQIVALPGGFSGGDEPEGSAKFIVSFLRNPRVAQAVTALLDNRDGLMCGICNGFQALVKLGLVPYGVIRDMDEECPTLTYNTIGRHQAMLVRTRVASNKSPWLSNMKVGDVHTVPVSHGEGRFIASESLVRQMADNGQIATQYVDLGGNPTGDIRHNPNNSVYAIEGITSPDGRIFGKMGHNERYSQGTFQNVPGVELMDIFSSAVGYYR